MSATVGASAVQLAPLFCGKAQNSPYMYAIRFSSAAGKPELPLRHIVYYDDREEKAGIR